MLLSELDQVHANAKQVNRELDFGPKKPGGPDKWSLDDKDGDDNGKLEDDETHVSKMPRRSPRGHLSTKAKAAGKTEPKVVPVKEQCKEDSDHMSDIDLYALAGLQTLKKTLAKVKNDIPGFLLANEADESGSVGNDDNDYECLHQNFDVKVKRMHTILKKQLKMQDMITMKTNLTNSRRVILSNPEKGMDSFFVAVGKFFIEEYASLEPFDVVTQMQVHLTYYLSCNRFKFTEVIAFNWKNL